MLNEQGDVVQIVEDQLPFSDTVFDVVETYQGMSLSTISVMQTGGPTGGTSNARVEMPDDPLYKVGEEYILFLVDISGDLVHARDRMLFQTVNPAGRYRVSGDIVANYSENLDSVALPTTVVELEHEIEQVIESIRSGNVSP